MCITLSYWSKILCNAETEVTMTGFRSTPTNVITWQKHRQPAKMATVINSVFAILLLFIACCSADSIFSRVLDDISSCSKSCANTYSPHTFEKVK